MTEKPPHVVIIGGGFAGLYAARALKKQPVTVTLVDRRNHHLFQPLLYQVATAGLNPGDIAQPIRSILRGQANCRVVLAEARSIDADARRVILDQGELSYDYLLVATGATHSYFGHEEWAEVAPGLKSIMDALNIRKRVLYAYEAAEREDDPEKRRQWMTFVIVGAGATGVEMAGTLAEIARTALRKDFRRIDTADARVVLIEGADRPLQAFPEDLSRKTRTQLEKLGVELRTNERVTNIDAEGVQAGDEHIPARTVVWAAGVRASSLVKTLGVPLDRAGRVMVEKDLSVPGHPEILVAGDVANLEQDGRNVFGVAPAAIQAGKAAAKNLVRSIEGKPRQPFHYVDKGSLATIGRRSAVADIKGLHLSGFIAWMAWLFVHVLFLIGLRNRLIVLFQWAWSYLTFQRGARLITGRLPKLDTPRETIPDRLPEPADRHGAPLH